MDNNIIIIIIIIISLRMLLPWAWDKSCKRHHNWYPWYHILVVQTTTTTQKVVVLLPIMRMETFPWRPSIGIPFPNWGVPTIWIWILPPCLMRSKNNPSWHILDTPEVLHHRKVDLPPRM